MEFHRALCWDQYVFFTLYTTPLNLYADNTQIYSKSKFNPNMVECLLIGFEVQREKSFNNLRCLFLGLDTNSSASPKNLVKYSTVAWISENTYSKHVGNSSIISVICVGFKKSLPLALAKQIAMALVSNKYYCNSLFHNMPETDIYVPQIQIVLLFPVYKPRLCQELSPYLTRSYGTPCLCPYVMPIQF